MTKLLILVCCVAFASAGPISPRIIGGGAPGGEHYTVSVQHSGNHICGGSVLTPLTGTTEKKFILTAAHCVYGLEPASLKVLVGTNKLTEDSPSKIRQLVDVTSITIHPDFDVFDLLNDIAVLKVKAIKEDQGTIPSITIVAVDKKAKYEYSGWGNLNTGKPSNELQTLSEIAIEDTNCPAGDNQFCVKSGTTNEQGACFGDAGGPLIKLQDDAGNGGGSNNGDISQFVSTNEQVGIVSYGYGCGGGKDVFTDVNANEGFINKVIAEEEQQD